jgi:hypothetical protein
MKTLNFKQDILPHLVAILLFVALVAVYFSPVIFEGKQLKQSDTVQWAGASSEISKHRDTYHEEPLWTNSQFGGMPAYVISVIYPGEWLESIDKAMSAGFPHPIAVFFVGLVCYYLLLLAYGVSPWLAIIGSIAFTFFSYNFVSIEAGHNSKVRAMTFAPMLIAGIVWAYRGRLLWGASLAALGTGLQLRSGHFQISYYIVFVVGILVINELYWAIKESKMKHFMIASIILAMAGGIGIGTSAARLMVLQEYTSYSMRGKPELKPKDVNKPKDGGLDRDYVFSWSNGAMENFTLLIPGLYGGSSSELVAKKSNAAKALSDLGADPSSIPQLPYYWGDQPFTSGPVYAGAIVMFLFILGLFVLDGRYKWWLLAAALLSIALATGKHFPAFNYLMYDYFPSYNKFRTVTMSIFIAQLVFPIMGVLAIQKLLTMPDAKAAEKKLRIAGGITAGICLLFWLIPGIAGDFTSTNDAQLQQSFGNDPAVFQRILSAIIDDRESMVRADALRSLAFILFAAGILIVALRKIINLQIAGLAIAILVLVDLWGVDKRYINKDSFAKTFYGNTLEQEASDLAILADKSDYRVLNLQNPFNETRTSYFHKSIGGYSPVKLRRYQDLIENDLTAEIDSLIGALRQPGFSPDQFGRFTVLNMLNTKYIKYGAEANAVIPNPAALGNAWFVNKVRTVSSPDAELEALRTISPRTEAVIDDQKFKVSQTSFDSTAGNIAQTAYRANRLEYKSNNTAKGLAVFSEIFYAAGWEATIDGKPADLIRVNYVLRGLEIPAGSHTIVMEFKPQTYYLGNNISMASSLLVMLGLVAAGFTAYRGIGKNKALETTV